MKTASAQDRRVRILRLRSPSCAIALILIVGASFAIAHPGNGFIVDPEKKFYFVSVKPIVGRQHHGCLWRLETPKKLSAVYTSKHSSSSLQLQLGNDRRIYCAERRYLGEQNGEDVYETELWRLADGKITRLLGPARGRQPFGGAAFAVDVSGTIYFAEHGVQIKKRDPDGKVSLVAGGARGQKDGSREAAQFDEVVHMAWGPQRTLYLLDGDSVRTVDAEATVRTLSRDLKSHRPEDGAPVLEEHGSLLMDLEVDARGVVYVADWGRRRVLRVGREGKISTVLISKSPWAPEGLAFLGSDLHILESTTPPASRIVPRIRKLEASGTATTVFDYDAR